MLERLSDHPDGNALFLILLVLVAVIFFYIGLWTYRFSVVKQLKTKPILDRPWGRVIGYALHFGHYVLTRADTANEILEKRDQAKEELL